MGAIGGGIWHGIKGARNSPKVSSGPWFHGCQSCAGHTWPGRNCDNYLLISFLTYPSLNRSTSQIVLLNTIYKVE